MPKTRDQILKQHSVGKYNYYESTSSAHHLYSATIQVKSTWFVLLLVSVPKAGQHMKRTIKRTTTHANVTQTVHNILPMVLPSLFAQLYSVQKKKRYQREKVQSSEGCSGMNFKWSRLRIDCA